MTGPTITRRAALLLGLGLVASACGTRARVGEDGRTRLSAGLSTTSSTVGQSYYSSVPRYLGYWDASGLDVEQPRFNGSGEAVTAVATNRLDIAHAGNFSNMAAHVNGNADTVAFMHDIPGNPYFPLVLKDSPIRTLADLQGTTLGIFSTASDANELLLGVMAQQGLDADSVTIVTTGVGSTAAEALRTGQIDGWMAYDSGAALLTTLGLDWRPVELDLFEDFGPGSGLIVRPSLIDEHRHALVAYGRGIAQAMVFTATNPEAAVRIHWQVFPESKPAGVAKEDALADGVVEMAARMEHVFPVGDQWGSTTDKRFQAYIDVFAAAGVLKKELGVGEIWTADLMADINNFDRAAIEEQARAFELSAPR